MFKLRPKTSEQNVTITIANRTIVRIVLVVIACMIGLAAVRQASHALLLIATAVFLTLALNSPVHWVARHLPGKRRGNRSLATAISFLLVIVVFVSFLASLVPPLVRQTNSFINAAPDLIQDSRSENSDIGKLIHKYHLEDQVDEFSKDLSSRVKKASGAAVSTVGKIGSSVFSVLTVLVLTFMMLIEGPRWLRFFRDLIPEGHQPHADRLAADMYRVVKGYVNGQVMLAAIAATLLLPALFALHVSYPIALVVVVFVCGLIPMVGHTIGAIIVTTVAVFHSPWSAIIILAYYILYQQIENYIIQPRIQANTTNMSPLLVFASVVVGVSFGGLFGGLVAIPLAGCVRIALLDYLRAKKIIEPQTFEEATSLQEAKA